MRFDRDRVQQILNEILDLPRQERSDRLEVACKGDEALRYEVESLLEHARDSSVEERSVLDSDTHPRGTEVHAKVRDQMDSPALELGFKHGDHIDHFQIIKRLGEGGFGEVYLAEQMGPVRRPVALKVIKPGMDTRAVVARFNSERQVLALMEHPGIARVYEAGATKDGRPYFVMEYVDGESVTEYCDKLHLDTTQRLHLFALICDAVQYAHQKGVIHRDLKPSNILVCDGEGESGPAVRVIDFGIAKATSEVRHAETALTHAGQMLGTPDYMSPEQTVLDPIGIDTRTDIYSLGVTLYEILTGVLPFENTTIRTDGLPHIQRLVRDFVPIRPSRRLSSVDPHERNRIAAARGVNIAGLLSMFRRELEWIPLKAMRKDPEERYATVADLSSDVRRYLAGEALLAGPESGTYRLGKFIKRHRGPVFAGLAIVLVLMVGVASTSIFAFRSSSHARTAMERAKELQQVVDFQSQQLAAVDPELMAIRLRKDLMESARSSLENVGLQEIEVEDRLDRFSEDLGSLDLTDVARKTLDRSLIEPSLEAVRMQFDGQPLVRAQLLSVLADTSRELGLVDVARAPQEEVLAIRRERLGENHLDTIEAVSRLGNILRGQGLFVESELHLRKALEKYEQVLGKSHPETFEAMMSLGSLYQTKEESERAVEYVGEALAGLSETLGMEHPTTLSAMASMGFILRVQGRYEEASGYISDALEGRRRVLGEDDPDTLRLLSSMGLLLMSQGKYFEAEPFHQTALERLRRMLGGKHPDTLKVINDLAHLYQLQGRFSESELYYREALEGHRDVFGDDHVNTMESINGMGRLLQGQGKYVEAKPFFEEALERRRRILGNDHSHTLTAMNNMGGIFINLGQPDEAERYWEEALQGYRRVLGNDHPLTLTTIHNMGGLLYQQGRYMESEQYLKEAIDGRRVVLGNDHPNTLYSIKLMGLLLQKQERYSEAEPFLQEMFVGLQRVLGEDHPQTLVCTMDFSFFLLAQGRFEEAAESSENLVPSMQGALGPEHPKTLSAIRLKARIHRGQGEAARSASLLRDALEIQMNVDGSRDAITVAILHELVDVLRDLDEHEEALELALECEGYARSAHGSDHEQTVKSVKVLVDLYESRHVADPAGGHDEEAKRWRELLARRLATYEAGASSSDQ